MVWEALCECGTTIYTVPSNNAQSCGCLNKEASRQWCSILGKRARKYEPNESLARKVWQRYDDHDIDFATFYHLSQSPCHYCGIPPATTWKKYVGIFTYNGLDRIDSSKPHRLDNVVPCCAECNSSKSDKSVNRFLAHARRISDHQESKPDRHRLVLPAITISSSILTHSPFEYDEHYNQQHTQLPTQSQLQAMQCRA